MKIEPDDVGDLPIEASSTASDVRARMTQDEYRQEDAYVTKPATQKAVFRWKRPALAAATMAAFLGKPDYPVGQLPDLQPEAGPR